MKSHKKSILIVLVILVISLLVVFFGNTNLNKVKPNMDASGEIDLQSKKDINNVLWQKADSEIGSQVSQENLDKITPKAFGQEVFTMLQDVKTKTIPLVQRTPARYDKASEAAQKGFTTRQAYSLGETMGLDYFNGYAGMKSIKELEFPRDYGMHNDFPFAWNFFASNLKDDKGNDIDLLIIYFRRAIYPPDVAKKMGLSEIDNQVIEQIVSIGYSDRNLHVQAGNPAISGKTGLIESNDQPFLLKIGKNVTKSISSASTFPMSMKIYDPEKDINIDLIYEETKPPFLQGDNGKVPSMYNLGTWYFSVPNIKVSGTVGYGDDVRKVSGKSWFDNQWTAGVMPAGYPDNYYVRGLSNIVSEIKEKPSAGWGWDWMDVQFDNDTEVTLANMHSTSSKDLKNIGENPPENSVSSATGKFINLDGTAETISATITINKWIKSSVSNAWYPDGWQVEIPQKNLSFSMTPTSPNQLFTTAGGSEVREGGVKAQGKMADSEIAGFGFGEGTAYAGEEFYFNTKFNILGIEDTPENRALFTATLPGIWLFIQSCLLYAVSLVLVFWILIFLYRLIFKRHSN